MGSPLCKENDTLKHKKISEIEFMDQPVYSINTDILKKLKI